MYIYIYIYMYIYIYIYICRASDALTIPQREGQSSFANALIWTTSPSPPGTRIPRS